MDPACYVGVIGLGVLLFVSLAFASSKVFKSFAYNTLVYQLHSRLPKSLLDQRCAGRAYIFALLRKSLL